MTDDRLRWGDLCRLTLANLQGDTLVVTTSKTGAVVRVLLRPSLIAELRMTGFRGERLVPFSETNSGGFNRTMRRRTGLKAFHVHQCRHTFACRYLEAGGNLGAVKELLGHSDIKTTQVYASLSDEAVRADHERVLAAQG